MLYLLVFFAFVGSFLLILAVISPADRGRSAAIAAQFQPRSIGQKSVLSGLAAQGVVRGSKRDARNAVYIQLLKQANWHWELGEPAMPNPKAPFWNTETLWGEKYLGLLVFAALGGVAVLLYGFIQNYPPPITLAAAVGASIAGAFMGYNDPDGKLRGAAARRQRELGLEMGFRLPELRSDVLSGQTIQRALRLMAKRPGGPFIEELRRAVAVLDITKDDGEAMNQLAERNRGNELAMEFANSVKMVTRQGGQIAPALNTLTELAQQRLRQTITAQGRRNLQEMTRPISLTSLFVMVLLVIFPAMRAILGAVN